MNKRTLVLGVIIGISICYVLFMTWYISKSKAEKMVVSQQYTYVLLKKDMKQYEKVTSKDIVKISTQDDKLGEIKMLKQINDDLLDISSDETYYLSKDINKYSILQDEYLLCYEEVISDKKEKAQSSNKMILELESIEQKEQEGFDIDENIKSSYETVKKSFDVSKTNLVTIFFGDICAKGELIEATDDYILLSLNEEDYEYFQSIKDTELIKIKLNYN